jgi:hypothetical protein
VAATTDKNIVGFDVVVNDSFGMRCVQAVRDIDRQDYKLIERQRPAGDAVLSASHSPETPWQ